MQYNQSHITIATLLCFMLLVCISCIRLTDKGGNALSRGAVDLVNPSVVYDASYHRISYPGGDVPADRGVCADVVVRAYRAIGVDLQQLIHEDMSSNFGCYSNVWGMTGPDANIDHRRVPNLMTFFERQGASVIRSSDPSDYLPGDVVAWRIHGGVLHIGMVTHLYNSSTSRPMVVHNIGRGQVLEDCLFNWEIIGHYRYR